MRSSKNHQRFEYSSQKNQTSKAAKLIIPLAMFAAVLVTVIAVYAFPPVQTELSSTNAAKSNEPVATAPSMRVIDNEISSSSDGISSSDSTPKKNIPAFSQPKDAALVLVNYEHILPDDYEVVPQFIGDDVSVDIKMYEKLTQLINDAWGAGLSLWVASGYRSVEDQEIILNRGIEEREASGMTHDEAEIDALKTISKPGYSEHHTGLAIDFNSVTSDFEFTKEYEWLKEHAAEYGFIQRYCSEKVDITKIDEEVWHYRYVGVENAKLINDKKMCLEEYVTYLNKQN